MGSTYSTGYHKTGWHFEQPSTGVIKQRLVGSSGSVLELQPGAKFRNKGVTTSTAGLARHATLNPDGLNVIETSGVYLLNPYRGSHAVVVSYNTAAIFIKGDSDNVGHVHFQGWLTSSKDTAAHVIKLQASSQLRKCMGSWADIYGISTFRAATRVVESGTGGANLSQRFASSTG